MTHANPFIAVSSESSRAELVEQMAPIVRRIANKVARGLPHHVRTDDLVSAGMIGLLEATQRFEPSRAESFVGYASLRIRGAILDELRRGDILSQDARMKSRLVQTTANKLQGTLGRAPTAAEMATALGVSEQEYVETLEGLTQVRLVAFDPQDESQAMVDANGQSPVDASMLKQLRGRLGEAITTLPQREKLILSLYYEQDLTYKEIGEVLDLTAARICQLHSQAVARLRERLDDVQAAAA
ncbi:MAG: FliA/WhiG family RNA polymerase sigma factor [Deltaproteobacteria bacterium]|nr:FliA/WhiG family RNA polymerase sigma factor [Deltaproteobacteria bacterium]